jgi:hypothetical protein
MVHLPSCFASPHLWEFPAKPDLAADYPLLACLTHFIEKFYNAGQVSAGAFENLMTQPGQ